MLFVKILFQAGIGLTGLLALLLDHKWHDKRRKIYKKLRNVLIVSSILLLVMGVALIIVDEKEKNKEVATLTQQLTLIRENGDNLNRQIEPFLKIATDRYPNLTSEKALDSLKEDIQNLNTKTQSLEKLELVRQVGEKELEILKKTPPQIDAILSMDNQRRVTIGIKFLNKVPIKFSYTLRHSKGDKELSNHNTGEFVLYPTKDHHLFYIRDEFNFRDHIPNDGFSTLKLSVSYQSIYFIETLNPNLKGTVTSTYSIDPLKNIITKEN